MLIAAWGVNSNLLKWGLTDKNSPRAKKISLSPNGLNAIILYGNGYIVTLDAQNGSLISGKKFTGTINSYEIWQHSIMRSLLINSSVNSAYALVYASAAPNLLF